MAVVSLVQVRREKVGVLWVTTRDSGAGEETKESKTLQQVPLAL